MRLVIFAAVLLALAQTRCNDSGPTLTAPVTNQVTITIPSGAMSAGSAAFGTNPLHVPLNSVVVWQNSDSVAHDIVSNTNLWNTGSLAAGATSGSVQFTSNGTYDYHCSIHNTMTGEIIVP